MGSPVRLSGGVAAWRTTHTEGTCSAARIELMVKTLIFRKSMLLRGEGLSMFPRDQGPSRLRHCVSLGGRSGWPATRVDQLPRFRNSSWHCCALWGPPSWS